MDIKKIVTKEESEKKRRTRNFLIGMVLVLIMVFSTAGYAINVAFSNQGSKNTNTVKYKGIEFAKDSSGYWEFQYNDQKFITQYNPLELNDTIVTTGLSLATYKGSVLYYEFNDSQDGAREILSNLWDLNQIPKRTLRACLSDNCTIDAPVKSCSEDKIISFRTPVGSETQRVYKEDNCVFIVANDTNQVKYSDAFLYNIIGI